MLFAPHAVASLLRLPPLSDQAVNYLRLVAVLASGVGMLYVVSGRLNALGFVFASFLLDRPTIPPLMVVLWYLGIVPGSAMVFSLQDFARILWTLTAGAAGARRRALDEEGIRSTPGRSRRWPETQNAAPRAQRLGVRSACETPRPCPRVADAPVDMRAAHTTERR